MPEIHAKLSASISKRWMLNVEKNLKGCPASITYPMRFPISKAEPNLAAATGTAAHYIGEWSLNEGKHPTEFASHHPKPYIVVDDGAGGVMKIDITDDLVSGPTLYCETIWADIERLEDEYLDEGQMFVEEQVCINEIFNESDLDDLTEFAVNNNILQLTGPDIDAIEDEGNNEYMYYREIIKDMFNMFGTNDFSFLIPGEYLGVYDYKNGRWSVDVENNTQFLYYALGAAYAHDWNFEVVEMVVIQPNDGSNPEKVRRWVITKEELATWIPIFRQAALDTIYKWEEFNPSKDNCHYCPAAGACKAQMDNAKELVKMDFADEYVDEQKIGLPQIGSLTYEQLGLIVKNADAIKNFVDSVVKFSKSRIMEGDDDMKKAAGKKLVAGRSSRKYSMTDAEVIEYLKDELLLDESDFMTPGKLMTITKLEKVVGKEVMAELTHRPEGSPTLVDEDDPREELATGAASDFEDDYKDDLD